MKNSPGERETIYCRKKRLSEKSWQLLSGKTRPARSPLAAVRWPQSTGCSLLAAVRWPQSAGRSPLAAVPRPQFARSSLDNEASNSFIDSPICDLQRSACVGRRRLLGFERLSHAEAAIWSIRLPSGKHEGPKRNPDVQGIPDQMTPWH